MKSGCLLLYALSLAGLTARSQPANENVRPPDFLFYESMVFAGADSTKARVDILYRIEHAFFVPVRNTDPTSPWSLIRRGEVLIELFDQEENSRARAIERFEFGAPETENESKQWREGIASFEVSPGTYSIVIEVDDLESERRYTNRDRIIRASQPGPASENVRDALFVFWSDTTFPSGRVVPQNFGGNPVFGKSGALFFEIPPDLSGSDTLSVDYSFSTPGIGHTEPKVVLSDTARPVLSLRGHSLKPEKMDGQIEYVLVPEAVPQWAGGILVPLPLEKLPQKQFILSLNLRNGPSRPGLQKTFHMVWPEMPASLRDLDSALDALRHITTKDELDSLKRGSEETRRINFESFWKQKDRTRETEYNEIMTEYYRRVDYAVKTFRTLRTVDGSRSDRGHIFILYGTPTRMERSLNPATGFQEIWIYENLKKKFVFLDRTKTGDYVLVTTQSL
jgi:GWxTD domain-containing protein